MKSYRITAIVVGVLFITATAAGILSVVTQGAILDGPDLLVDISANQTRMMIAAILQMVMAFACAGIAIGLYPVIRKHHEELALGSVVFRAIEAVLFLVSATLLLALVALSGESIKAGAPDTSHLNGLGIFIVQVGDWLSTGAGAIRGATHVWSFGHLNMKLVDRCVQNARDVRRTFPKEIYGVLI